jgi:phosphoesterase RecJ-like protein
MPGDQPGALYALLQACRRPLLICHLAPDGDALGSLLGLKDLLEDQGKEAVAAVQDGVPEAFRFLPGWEAVRHEARDEALDLIVALDASDLQRLGSVYEAQHHGRIPLLNIDHHVTNTLFGTINLVDSQATSTAEIVVRLAAAMDWPLRETSAQCLLAGVVADTLCFRTSNVSASTLELAQSLMQAGASLYTINEHLFNRRSAASICLWGKALARMRLRERIIWTTIPLAARAECDGVAQSDTGLANHLVSAIEADVAAVLSEQPEGRVDVGLRAGPGFDVAQVALALGGGGHAQAAGCTLQMSLADAEETVVAALRRSLVAQRAPTD